MNSLLILIDDIAAIMDDVALMTKVAAKKTAGVLGDDLALNAEQVSGVKADRELPVVWAVAKGSFKNKLLLVPAALLISVFIPWLIMPLLMVGGAYLCFEGAEKIIHNYFHNTDDEHQQRIDALHDPNIDIVEFEQTKIKGAIRTDFILSAELIVIALGTVKDAPFTTQALVVTVIAFSLTIAVYGLVAAIVRLDDRGLALTRSKSTTLFAKGKRRLGHAMLWFAPVLMKTLTIVGTIAMFLVGGGILLHGIPALHHVLVHSEEISQTLPVIGSIASLLTAPILNGVTGLISGGILFVIVNYIQKFTSGRHKPD